MVGLWIGCTVLQQVGGTSPAVTIVEARGPLSAQPGSGGSAQCLATCCVALRGDAYSGAWEWLASQEADDGWACIQMHQSYLQWQACAEGGVVTVVQTGGGQDNTCLRGGIEPLQGIRQARDT